MKKIQKSWTEYDIKYLTENYGILKTKQIAIDLKRTYQSIKSMAIKRLKLKHPGLCKENLLPLLNDSNETWYWLGFIAADGNINKHYLNVLVHIQDIDHLQLLANKLNVKISFFRKKYPKISVSDTINISLLKNKLKYNDDNNKTINSLDIENYDISNDYFLSFITGLIDGDGCIEVRNEKMAQLKIECHSSWQKNFEIISTFLLNKYNIQSKTIINNRGYVLWKITKHANGLILREEMKRLNIPYLKRKWDKFIDI